MRGPYAKVAARNGALLERVRELKADHPFCGYRRVWAYLRYIDGLTVNQKRVLRRDEGQGSAGEAEPEAAGQARGGHQEATATRPNEWWGIDMNHGHDRRLRLGLRGLTTSPPFGRRRQNSSIALTLSSF
jgi:putative transposase